MIKKCSAYNPSYTFQHNQHKEESVLERLRLVLDEAFYLGRVAARRLLF